MTYFMKIRQELWIIVVLVVAIMVVWLSHRSATKIHSQTETISSTMQSSNSESQKIVNAPITSQSQSVTTTSLSRNAQSQQSPINKEEIIFESQKRQYLQPQSFYGKIIDQNGNPVSGVEVAAGNEALKNGTENEIQAQTFTAQSDSDGLFEITGKTGTPIGVRLSKNGYLWGLRGEGYKAPSGGASSPSDRVILTMWKLRGAESLASSSIDAKIPFDGTSTGFDIATGKQSIDGNLLLTLIRSPLEVRRGKDLFDWTVKIEVVHGGIVEENDPYPYWAPESSYKSSFEFNVSSNNVPWESTLSKNFYIKMPGGQYGRMQAKIFSALTPARIQADFTINPSGSQNLEPK